MVDIPDLSQFLIGVILGGFGSFVIHLFLVTFLGDHLAEAIIRRFKEGEYE